MKTSKFVIKSALVAALGGLLFGFDTAVISGTTETIQNLWNLSDAWLGFTVASALLGTIIGSIIVSWPTDKMGRRNMLMVLGLFYFFSAVGSALAWDWYSFLFFRFLGGLGVGGASVVSPMYIAEISPAKTRGRLVALAQFNIVLGILLAFFSNYIITLLNLGAVEWRWMFGVEAFPAAAFFVLLFSNPFSPRWLVAKGRTEEAKIVLHKIEINPMEADAELTAIQESLDLEHHQLNEPFYTKKYLKPIMLAFLIAFFNQVSGINAILYYAPKIFKMAGAAAESALLQSVIIGLTNLIFTILALGVIDYFGRKILMIAGSIGYIISLSTASWTFFQYGSEFSQTGGIIVLSALILFIASHAFGQGAVIWVFISEIFPNRVRARGQALGSFTHWIFAALISQTFPVIAGTFGGGGIFALYAFMMVLQLIWVLTIMPETKGVPLEEIQKKLGIE
jgi:SP family xylose:H+ symportor-like MFS transporter